MPFTIRWESDVGAHAKFFGSVTFTEIRGALEIIGADARYDDIRYYHSDYLDASVVTISDDDIEELAVLDFAYARSNPRLVNAVVTTAPDLIKLFTAFNAFSELEHRVAIFPDLAAARAWLSSDAMTRRNNG